MPLINLIQERRQAIKQRETQARAYFFAFVGTTTLSVLGFGALWLATESVKGKANELRNQIDKLEPSMKELKSSELLLSNLQPRVETLTEGTQATQRWVRILDHVSRNTPSGTWLTQLRSVSSDPTKPIELNLSGMSRNQDLVGEVMLRLQDSKDLSDVALRYSQERQLERATAIEFEVAASLQGTERKKEMKDEKKA